MPRFTGFRPDVRFLGSTLTLVLGAMYFLGTVGQIAQGVNSTGPVVGPVNSTGLVVGPMMFLGALAYRSRKRTPRIGKRPNRRSRRILRPLPNLDREPIPCALPWRPAVPAWLDPATEESS